VLVVITLLTTSLGASSNSTSPSIVKTIPLSSNEVPLASSQIENFSHANQFQAGTIFDNQSYSIGLDPMSLDFAVGDLNRDGISDVATISKQTNDICIYNRSANGALSSIPWRISKPGIVDMRSIAIGDLNNTGLNDIVVSYNDSTGNGHVAVFYQSSSRPFFSSANVTTMNVDSQPYKLVIGKFDGSNKSSIATVCMGDPLSLDDNINIWRYPFSNPSTNFWRIPISISGVPVFTKSKFLAAGDINGDGRSDLIVGNESGSNVFIALQPAAWRTPWTLSLKPIPGSASDIALVDVTGDGLADLIFADASNAGGYSTVRIYPNSGSGFPSNPPNAPLRTQLGLGTVAVGKLNNDSSVDLAILSKGNASVSAYYQYGLGLFGQNSNLTFPVDESPLKAVVDSSITGYEDIFVLSQGPSGGNGTLSWFRTDPSLTGNANFNIFSGADKSTTLATGRLANGDIVVASSQPASNKVLLYEKNTTASWTVLTQNGPIAAVFGKFSSTNQVDLAVLNSGSHSISLYHGSQLQTNNQPYKNIILPFTVPSSLSAMSIRGDGYEDLLVGYGQGCYILYNTLDGQPFNVSSSETLGNSIIGNRVSIVEGDFNNDHNSTDVALLNTATNHVEIYLRNKTGVLGSYYQHTPKTNLSTSIGSDLMQSIALGNFDNLPGPDVAAITQSGRLLIFLQPGYGFNDTSFIPDSSFKLGGKPASLSAGDVNDDGLTDIVIGFADSPRLAVYLRTGSDKFADILNFTTGAAPTAILAQDIDGDGRSDISCASPGSHSISVWLQNNLAPVAKIAGPSHAYRGVIVSFSGAQSQDSLSDNGSLNYTWTFGDGSAPKYTKTVSHVYNSNLTYNVTLRVTDRSGLGNSAKMTLTVLQTYPSSNLTVWPLSPPEGSWILFNDTSFRSNITNSPIQKWQWEFDDAAKNITQNASQQFGAGEHKVRLMVTDADGISNWTVMRFFNVTMVLPLADFDSSTAKVGSPVYFNSTSSFAWSSIVDYKWNFGDGTETDGTSYNVVHTFNTKGNYRVVLNVTDERGNWDEKVLLLHVDPTPPKVTLTLNGQSVEGLVTKFNVSTFTYNQILSWNWSYDNNQTWHLSYDASTGTTFTFGNNGSYWVSLNVTQKDGSWSIASILVNVQDTAPDVLGFWAPGGTTYDMDQAVSFWATAVPTYKPITKYEWNFDFGSGGAWVASTPLMTNHTSWSFTKPGNHYVMVRVWDDDGFTEYSTWIEVRINDPAPVAHFSYQNSTQTSGQVLFDATLSTDTPTDIGSLTYSWNFGDQSGWTPYSMSNRTISHEFAHDGRYSITLLVMDQWGVVSAQVQISILVDKTPPIVVMESNNGNSTAGQTITVMANITDDYGLKNVILEYQVNNGSWIDLPMTAMDEPDMYYGQIPAQTSNTNVSYLVIATDNNNNVRSTQTYLINVKEVPPSLSLEDLTLIAVLIAVIVAILAFLLYRVIVPVDEVFIIFQDGQLMAHQTRRIKPGMDDDILASMFVAIQMFVKDSFKDESSTHLNRLDFGKKKILVEKGESFYLAVVLHSKRTGSVPKRMQSVIEDIQVNFGPTLKAWDGDLEKVRGVKDSMKPLVKRKNPFEKK